MAVAITQARSQIEGGPALSPMSRQIFERCFLHHWVLADKSIQERDRVYV